jgi:ABC-2 type transport system permease protein
VNARRYLRLYRIFARNNIVRELEFRGNFWAKIGVNICWLASYVVFLEVIFRNTTTIAGWNKGQMILLFGTFLFSRALMDMIFTINLGKIPELVRLGTMDFVLTKPIPSQFFVSTRYLSLDESGTLLGACAILLYGAALTHLVPTVAQIAAWMFLVLCGLLLLYAVQLTLMTLAFWLVKIDNLGALVDTVVGVARYPANIFAPPVKFAITFIIPLAFIAYVPTLALKDGVRPAALVAAVAITTVFVTAASLFWRYATRAYTSASS